MTLAGFAAQWGVGGGKPLVFHVVTIGLSVVVSGLVAGVSGALFGPVVALVAGLLFAVHPVHVEVTATAVGQAELLAAAWYLVVLWAAWQASAGPGSPAKWVVLAAMAAALGLGAKEHVITVPVAVMVVWAWRAARDGRTLAAVARTQAALLLVVLAVVLGYVLIRRVILADAKAVDAVEEAARAFVSEGRPEDSLAVILFADRPLFAHDLSTVREHSYEAVGEYAAKGGTALYDALCDAMMRLKSVRGRKVVVALTDGRDESNPGTAPGSLRTIKAVYRTLDDVDATVFAIGLGPKVDRALLERLAATSGGEAYFPQDVSTLAADYQRIVENLRRRYVISYTSTNSTRDGKWRKVEIGTRFPDADVTSRGGYYAPAK